MSEDPSTRIRRLTQPYRDIVGESGSTPQPLSSLTYKRTNELIEDYKRLVEYERKFMNPPEGTEQQEREWFAYWPDDHEKSGPVPRWVQREMWFGFPKRRIQALFMEYRGGLPDEDVIQQDLTGAKSKREAEIGVILTLDENSWLDTTPTDTIAANLDRQAEIPEFLEETYGTAHEALPDLIKQTRPGVRLALLDVYDERMEKLDAAVIEFGVGRFGKKLVEVTETVREEQTAIESEVMETIEEGFSDIKVTLEDLQQADLGNDIKSDLKELSTQMKYLQARNKSQDENLGTIEEEVKETRNAVREEGNQTRADVSDEHKALAKDYYFETQQMLVELESEIGKLRSEAYGGNDAGAAISDQLDELESRVDNLLAELNEHRTTTEQRVEELYMEVLGSVDEDAPAKSRDLLQEMAMVELLLQRLESLSGEHRDR